MFWAMTFAVQNRAIKTKNNVLFIYSIYKKAKYKMINMFLKPFLHDKVFVLYKDLKLYDLGSVLSHWPREVICPA